jgi:hypothetical protein
LIELGIDKASPSKALLTRLIRQAVVEMTEGQKIKVAGLLRKANHLARGALVAAANVKCQTASAEHVRLAATELI